MLSGQGEHRPFHVRQERGEDAGFGRLLESDVPVRYAAAVDQRGARVHDLRRGRRDAEDAEAVHVPLHKDTFPVVLRRGQIL